MLDESIVQNFCRIRVHATKRVESKRNEAKVVPVTDLPVRLDVVVVEQLKGRQGTGLSLSPVIDTKGNGRITDGHIQNVRSPALIGDMEVQSSIVDVHMMTTNTIFQIIHTQGSSFDIIFVICAEGRAGSSGT